MAYLLMAQAQDGVGFGAVPAGASRHTSSWMLPFRVWAELAESLSFLAAVGLISIGASGLLAWAIGDLFSKTFISGDGRGVEYTASRCADLLEYFPRAGGCHMAATLHHFEEVVQYRSAAGVLGLGALAAFLLIRAFNRRKGPRFAYLPDGFTESIGAAVFGLGASGLGLMSFGYLVFQGTRGAGALLSGAAVALVVFLAFALSLIRVLRRRVDAVLRSAS